MIGRPPYRLLTSPQECSFHWKNSFFVVVQHWCRATFFQYKQAEIAQIIEVMLTKRNGKLIAVNVLLNLTPLGLPHIQKDQICSMTKSAWKSEFHPYVVFSTRAQRSVIPSKNFALSGINKDQLKDM